MRNISVLDCTLRDGGCVNDFNFGQYYMDVILSGLEESGVDIIECGYIDHLKGYEQGRTMFCNEQVIHKYFLKNKKDGILYVAMIDYGKFDVETLHPRTPDSIDGIRLAFHKKDRYSMIDMAKTILNKGYNLFIQPMTTLRYTDSELIEFIELVNIQLPTAYAFYLVDSFGEMRLNDCNRLVSLIDYNLNPDIAMGFHSHNNLQLSYSNGVTLLNFPTSRTLILDSSIMGMGKGAGNMNTELFTEHLNLYYGKNYNISPLLEVIDSTLNQIRETSPWGYSIEYYLSSINHCTPSYASHYYRKHQLSVEQVSELLSQIPEEKKISFDKSFADELYFQYNSNNYDDSQTVESLKKVFDNHEVLLIAPGKSIETYCASIQNMMVRNDIISIELNTENIFNPDYLFVSKSVILNKVMHTNCSLLLTSNVINGDIHSQASKQNILSYNRLVNSSYGKYNNALFMILNLLHELGTKKILLAGFDGFTSDVHSNYYSYKLSRPVSKEKAVERNGRMQSILQSFRDVFDIQFLTPSIYQNENII